MHIPSHIKGKLFWVIIKLFLECIREERLVPMFKSWEENLCIENLCTGTVKSGTIKTTFIKMLYQRCVTESKMHFWYRRTNGWLQVTYDIEGRMDDCRYTSDIEGRIDDCRYTSDIEGRIDDCRYTSDIEGRMDDCR